MTNVPDNPGPALQGKPAHDGSGPTRALVIGPYTKAASRKDMSAVTWRSPAMRIDEANGLALAIDLDILSSFIIPLTAPRPASYLGKGKVEEIAGIITAEEIGLVVMDCALSPVQQRNLEKAWACKVIDRTGLILEIFGRRARTREGSLQVEYAHLAYQKSRLVRSWTHLERQRGGFGFLGGPGETQIEADRRLIQERMTRIERDLAGVAKTRALHRQSRRRVPYPIVALVGYTNAGKSTLFNRLTQAEVLAQDQLFATLDPTARLIRLPHGERAILSDTVGFISELPTMLIAAFKATLEDVTEADVLLHVRDVTHEETEAQAQDVKGVLEELGIGSKRQETMIEVWNKADLLDEAGRERLGGLARHQTLHSPVLVSALNGDGLERLLAMIENTIARDRSTFWIRVDSTNGQGLNWLYEQTEILERRQDGDQDEIVVIRIEPEKEPRLMQRFPGAKKIR